jgi:hypothetical protein
MTEHRLTAKEVIARPNESYFEYLTKEEIEEWQPICVISPFSQKHIDMKVKANNLLRSALWKYSRVLDYHGFEHGMYEYFMQALNMEAESLKKMKGNENLNV